MPPIGPFTEAGEPPLLLTLDEAARMMRVGRSRAYEMAHDYIDSGGTAGLPVILFGPGCFRVPRWALMELITTGRVARLCAAVGPPTGVTVVH